MHAVQPPFMFPPTCSVTCVPWFATTGILRSLSTVAAKVVCMSTKAKTRAKREIDHLTSTCLGSGLQRVSVALLQSSSSVRRRLAVSFSPPTVHTFLFASFRSCNPPHPKSGTRTSSNRQPIPKAAQVWWPQGGRGSSAWLTPNHLIFTFSLASTHFSHINLSPTRRAVGKKKGSGTGQTWLLREDSHWSGSLSSLHTFTELIKF
ncbi:hypothetical protein BDP55DRAFT_324914 [Colletotrichum godetiae]|uniref:Uncharacterized protein n=1 Tax=Colletotrichum godetiae TaxID=1209918 RepID=A0AAJ0ABN7_9PEZI|nr:uncharacterized protein BDP55DRAFT_324914 [Colletotrichum godetiae]KAK1660081.1 hypothetical protein BDP55DRAFT_324914 [Colletotrichum godetiae]